MTVTAITQTAAREKELLKQWFETVAFDEESEGIPPLEPEDDDEPPEPKQKRSEPEAEPQNLTLSDVDMDDLMEELRKRDPENPF